MQKLLKVVIVCLMAIAGFVFSEQIEPYFVTFIDSKILNTSFFGITLTVALATFGGAIVGAAVGLLISAPVIRWLLGIEQWVEDKLFKMSLNDIIAMFIGLAAGLIIANLISSALIPVPVVGPYLPVFINILLGFLGVRVAVKKSDDLLTMFGRMPSKFRRRKGIEDTPDIVGCRPSILDTSVVIDGRIADIAETGFLPGELIIPRFVIGELQLVADSSDGMKRSRGRRGLDVLARMQKNTNLVVQIVEQDFHELEGVDNKLVRLATEIGGNLVTNDYNLNKVAVLQGIKVLNINELANAIKPVVLPGEEMIVRVIKEGKEQAQGIGYLDDGTMVVVEGGRKLIDREVHVTVTSVIQTAAGKMIFTKTQ